MREHALRTIALALVLPGLLIPTACVCSREKVETGELVTETRTVELGDAESVDVVVDMAVGGLTIRGGADRLLDAEFTYNVPEWKPIVDYHHSGGKGELTVRHPSNAHKQNAGDAKVQWDLALADDVPLALTLEMGVGDASLVLGDLEVTRLDVAQGVGCLVVDLTGERTNDLVVNIEGGVGDATIKAPTGVGVRLDTEMGIGSISSHGLVKRGDVYVNDAYGESDVTIDIRVEAGIGSITVDASESGSLSA